MGSFFLYIMRRVLRVTFFLNGLDCEPRGEWELSRVCNGHGELTRLDADGSKGVGRGDGREARAKEVRVLRDANLFIVP